MDAQHRGDTVRSKRVQSFILVSNEISEKRIAEYEDESCADKIEYEVEKRINLTVGDEYRFEPDSAGGSVNNVLHEFPDDPHGSDTGNDSQSRVYAQPPREYVNQPPEKCRRVNMRQMVPPPDIVVLTEHPDGVRQHRCLYVDPLPWAELNGATSLQDGWQVRSSESDDRIHNRPRIPFADPLDKDDDDTRANHTLDNTCDIR